MPENPLPSSVPSSVARPVRAAVELVLVEVRGQLRSAIVHIEGTRSCGVLPLHDSNPVAVVLETVPMPSLSVTPESPIVLDETDAKIGKLLRTSLGGLTQELGPDTEVDVARTPPPWG